MKVCSGFSMVEEGAELLFDEDNDDEAAEEEEEEVGGTDGELEEPEGETVTSPSCFILQLSNGVTFELFVVDPPNSTAGPGLGKTGSTPSTVVQVPSSKVFARYSSGPVNELDDPPVMSTMAQCWYISRLPT